MEPERYGAGIDLPRCSDGRYVLFAAYGELQGTLCRDFHEQELKIRDGYIDEVLAAENKLAEVREALKHAQEVVGSNNATGADEVRLLEHIAEALSSDTPEPGVGVDAGTETVCGEVAPHRPSARPASVDSSTEPSEGRLYYSERVLRERYPDDQNLQAVLARLARSRAATDTGAPSQTARGGHQPIGGPANPTAPPNQPKPVFKPGAPGSTSSSPEKSNSTETRSGAPSQTCKRCGGGGLLDVGHYQAETCPACGGSGLEGEK